MPHTSHQHTGPGHITLLSLLVVLAILAVETRAAEGWMAGVQTTLAWDTYRQISISEVGTGTVINGQLDGAVRDPRTEDYTGAVNFTLARYLKPTWRVETSYQYRYRSDWDVALTTPSLQTITNLFSNIRTHTLAASLIYEHTLPHNWRWQAGAGFGWSLHRWESEYLERAVPGIRSEFRSTTDDHSNSFAWHVVMGASRPFTGFAGREWHLQFRYRYVDFAKVELGDFRDRAATGQATYTSHEILLGVESAL